MQNKSQNINENSLHKIRVGITHGDINGIGYEIIIKALSDPYILELCTPIVYGSSKIASYHKKTVDFKDFNFNLIKSAEQAHPKRTNIVNVIEKEVKIDLGKSTDVGGQLSLLALELAVEDLKKGNIDVLVTAPINKNNIQAEKFKFNGHTEYLSNRFQGSEPLMLMVSDKIRIGVATGHVSLKEVPNFVTKELLLKKIKILNASLKWDFCIQRPKIAVLSLNPHASDDGLIGKEENEIIIPSIKTAFDSGITVFGPYPADGFFGTTNYTKFDAILAMYHDQGMLPFKLLAFDNGVNYTAGLPFVRTSPAHGTGYEIAGKNLASATSFRESIYLACDIYKNRQMQAQLNSNPLKTTVLDDEKPNAD